MKDLSFLLRGDFCFCGADGALETHRDAFAVCENGLCRGVFDTVPDRYAGLPLHDRSGMLILPGMCDLHIHAPQFAYRGLGMDLELLDWLYRYAFPEEAKYADLAYAEHAYGVFAERLRRSATTRAVIFATVHREATELLMDGMEMAKIPCFVGKLNMDRDAPDNLREPDAAASAAETERWILETKDRYRFVKPIITPRFLPSCTDTLLAKIGELARRYGVPVQSHLSENPSEVELVRRLFPDTAFYGEGYDRYGLFGQTPTVMAHCIYSSDAEIALMKKNGVFAVHCPASNMNVCSGIAPMRRYLDAGLRTGLATDVAGGESESMFRSVMHAVQSSKMYWRLVDQSCAPLTFDEAFRMATVSGGEFFGRVGTFLDGYEFDALVIDDRDLCEGRAFTVHERTERAVYLSADLTSLRDKFARGERVL